MGDEDVEEEDDDAAASVAPEGDGDGAIAALEREAAALQREMTRASRDADAVTEDMREDVMRLLEMMGVPYVVAPMEAEAQCAYLEVEGWCEGVVTDDSDAFCFGAKKVYKNIFDDRKYVEAYYASDCRTTLRLERDEFCGLALLLGGDYSPGVKGVGVVNAMEILQAFHFAPEAPQCLDALKTFKAWLDGAGDAGDAMPADDAMRDFAKTHKSARTRWQAPPSFPSEEAMKAYLRPSVADVRDLATQLGVDCDDGGDVRKHLFTWTPPDETKLRRLCANDLGWSDSAVDAALDPMLVKTRARSKQDAGLRATRLDAYYESYHSNATFATVTSDRLRAALAPPKPKPKPGE